ncbi:MAG: hypothetical protein ACRDNB_09210 [Gaiellaceae bacterium]
MSVEPAYAHVVVQPSLVEQGAVVDLLVELPQLREGSQPARLELDGAGITVLSSRLQGAIGTETRWSLRIRADADPGVVPVVLRAVYRDGRSVEVDQPLTVVPAEESDGFPAAAAVGVVLLAGLAAATLFLVRRRA